MHASDMGAYACASWPMSSTEFHVNSMLSTIFHPDSLALLVDGRNCHLPVPPILGMAYIFYVAPMEGESRCECLVFFFGCRCRLPVLATLVAQMGHISLSSGCRYGAFVAWYLDHHQSLSHLLRHGMYFARASTSHWERRSTRSDLIATSLLQSFWPEVVEVTFAATSGGAFRTSRDTHTDVACCTNTRCQMAPLRMAPPPPGGGTTSVVMSARTELGGGGCEEGPLSPWEDSFITLAHLIQLVTSHLRSGPSSAVRIMFQGLNDGIFHPSVLVKLC